MTPHAVALLLFIQVLGGFIPVESSEPVNETHPWLATILNDDSRILCSASIISRSIILTSGTCASRVETNSFKVWVGLIARRGSSIHKIVEIRAIHGILQKFDNFVYHDIALIRVSPPFKFGEHVNKILLPSQEEVVASNTVVSLFDRLMVPGEGNYHNENHKNLTKLRIVDSSECSDSLDFAGINWTKQVCAVLDAGTVCNEDSGGPLVTNGVQVGIVPWTWSCKSSNDPRVYIDVAHYRNWIDGHLNMMEPVND